MLRILFFFILFCLNSFPQIVVDENSLIAKPKNKSNPTVTETSTKSNAVVKKSSNQNDIKKNPKTSGNTKPHSTRNQKPTINKTSTSQTKPQQPPTQNKTSATNPIKPQTTQIPISQPPSTSPSPSQVKKTAEPKMKLSNPSEKNETIPPLSEEDLNTPITTTNDKKTMSPNSESNIMNANSSDDIDRPKYKNRKAWTIDYNTWYEMLIVKDKTNSTYGETKSHYFGVGYYYDYTVYEEKYGYAASLGFIIGNAQAGTVNTGEYYERRITWMGYRAGGRLFFRANNRIDIGPALIIQYKNTNWPEETNFKVMSQANPQYFMYLDTRWRLNYPLELIQSFGFHTRQYALIWRLGVNYTFN